MSDAYTTDWEAYLASTARTDPLLKPRLADYLVGESDHPPEPEEMGYKDTVKAPPGIRDEGEGQVHAALDGLLDYNPKTRSFGSWVYHCHILEHEENDMMRPFEVVK